MTPATSGLRKQSSQATFIKTRRMMQDNYALVDAKLSVACK